MWWNVVVALDAVDLKPGGKRKLNVKDFMRDTLDEDIHNVQYKLNSVLARHGMDAVRMTIQELEKEWSYTGNLELMVDLKWSDITNTNENYLEELAESWLGEYTTIITIRWDMPKGWWSTLVTKAKELWLKKAKIITVPVLTTFTDEDAYREYWDNLKNSLLKKAKHHLSEWVHGIVFAPAFWPMLRSVFGNDFLTVTPNIRPAGIEIKKDDQNKDTQNTPPQAVKNWITHMVIGRPITEADNPKQALFDILASIKDIKPEPSTEDFTMEKLIHTGSWEDVLEHIRSVYRTQDGEPYTRLTSGLIRDGYINFWGRAERNPQILKRATSELLPLIMDKSKFPQLYNEKWLFDAKNIITVGAQMWSVRISAFIADAMGCEESLYAEKDPNKPLKSEDNLIWSRHDKDLTGKKVVITEDLASAGKTSRQLIKLVQERGGEVVAVTAVVNTTNPHADNIDGVPLLSLCSPQFNEFWDEKTPENKRAGYPKIHEWAIIEPDAKAKWNDIIAVMDARPKK